MAEITIKRVGSHLRKLFEILINNSEGLPARDALKQLAATVELTPYESGVYETTGTRRFEKIVRFATVDCVKAEWLLKDKGVWSITDAGIKAYKQYADPESFYREAIRLYRVWKHARGNAGDTNREDARDESSFTDVQVDEKEARVTFEQAEEQASNEIESFVLAMPPFEFQDLVADLLKGLGYHISWIAPPGKDGGVDIIAHVDPLGTQTPRIKVQVKRVSQRVDTQTLHSFLAVINEDDVGLFVSTGGFTKDAEEAARKQTSRKITLINLDRLVELWIEAYAKLEEKARQRLRLSPIYFLTPDS